jgi:hypothetical protein
MSRRLSFSLLFLLMLAACDDQPVVTAQVIHGPWQQRRVECEKIADWLNQIDKEGANDSIKILTEIDTGTFSDKVFTICYVIWRK